MTDTLSQLTAGDILSEVWKLCCETTESNDDDDDDSDDSGWRVMAGRGGCCRDWWRCGAAGPSAQPLVAASPSGRWSQCGPDPGHGDTSDAVTGPAPAPPPAPPPPRDHAPCPAARVAQEPAPPCHVTRVAPPPPRPCRTCRPPRSSMWSPSRSSWRPRPLPRPPWTW